MVVGGHVGDLDIKVEYQQDNDGFRPYTPSCPDDALKDDNPEEHKTQREACTDLNYDDEVELQITFDASLLNVTDPPTLKVDGRSNLGRPVKYKVEACFANGFTSRRKWRKAKDIIQDDKRCSRQLQKKTDLTLGPNTFTYKLKSDTPGAQYFVTVLIFCERENEPEHDQYCFFDTTGPLGNLASIKEIEKRDSNLDGKTVLASRETSPKLQYKTSVPDFRTTGLVVGVIVLSICSVSMLFGYFTFERLLKKSN